jgi:hypothetical protein
VKIATCAVLLLLAGCSAAVKDVRSERLEVLKHIERQCGLPSGTIELIGTDDLHFKPAPDTPYAKVDCGLEKIKESRLPFRLGFVGNETYSGEAK